MKKRNTVTMNLSDSSLPTGFLSEKQLNKLESAFARNVKNNLKKEIDDMFISEYHSILEVTDGLLLSAMETALKKAEFKLRLNFNRESPDYNKLLIRLAIIDNPSWDEDKFFVEIPIAQLVDDVRNFHDIDEDREINLKSIAAQLRVIADQIEKPN